MGRGFAIFMAHVGTLRTFGAPAPLTLGVMRKTVTPGRKFQAAVRSHLDELSEELVSGFCFEETRCSQVPRRGLCTVL